MRTELYLKTQTELVNECEARMNDSNNKLGSVMQYEEAVNEAVRMWGRRVVIPRIYTFEDAFVQGTFEYTLPSYIRPPFTLQTRSSSFNYLGNPPPEGDDTNITYHQVAGYEIEPTSTGGWQIRLPSNPYTDTARVIWYGENTPMPTGSTTVASDITSSSTSVTITEETVELGPVGVFKCESEWSAYAGYSNNGTVWTLSNLIRGLDGTTAAAHVSTTAVTFGVAVDDTRLWVQLYDYVAAYIHALNMHKSTGEDMGRHEKLMSFYQQKADNFWRNTGYISQQKANRLLTPIALGGNAW